MPLTLFGVSGNYASALYLSAVKANKLDKVESELIDFVEASKRSSTFSQFMKDLSVPGDTRIKAIKEICAGAKFSDIMNNFLGMAKLLATWISCMKIIISFLAQNVYDFLSLCNSSRSI